MRTSIQILAGLAIAGCAQAGHPNVATAPPERGVAYDKAATCAESPPERSITVKEPLSEHELLQIGSLVGETPEHRIIRIQDGLMSGKEGRSSSSGRRLLSVSIYGGYNRCVGFGRNRVVLLEEVDGNWEVVDQPETIIELVH